MASNLYWLIVGVLFLCGIWAAVMFYKNPSWALAMLLPILAWLIFDPLVVAVGNSLGEGATLQVLHLLRHLLRAIATPFLLIIAFDQAKRARVKGTDDLLIMLVLGIIILALVVLGIMRGFAELTLEPIVIEGIKQYQPDTPLGLPLAAIATMGLIAILGIGVLLKARAPWLLLGGSFVLVGLIAPSFLALPSALFAATSIALVLGFLFTELRLQKIAPNPAVR